MRSPAIEFRLTPAEKEAIFRYANTNDVTVSKWLRTLAVAFSMPENENYKCDMLILKSLKSCAMDCEKRIEELNNFQQKIKVHIENLESREYDDAPWWEFKSIQDLIEGN